MQNKANSGEVGRGRPTGEEMMMQNKAKLGQAGTSGGRRVGGAYCAKQSQFLNRGLRIGDRPAAGRRSWRVPRSPLAPPASGLPPADCAKRTQFGRSGGAPEGKICKTNPIPATPGGTGPQGRRTRGQSCETKPISPLRIADRGLGTDLRRDAPAACRLGPVVQTNPIGWSELCKTNPIRHPARWDQRDRSRETKLIAPWKVSGGDAQPTKSRGLSRETNPISGGRHTPPFQYFTIPAFQSDADCAKRTQFGRSGGAPEGETCETKPICRAHRWAPPVRLGSGPEAWSADAVAHPVRRGAAKTVDACMTPAS